MPHVLHTARRSAPERTSIADFVCLIPSMIDVVRVTRVRGEHAAKVTCLVVWTVGTFSGVTFKNKIGTAHGRHISRFPILQILSAAGLFTRRDRECFRRGFPAIGIRYPLLFIAALRSTLADLRCIVWSGRCLYEILPDLGVIAHGQPAIRCRSTASMNKP